MSANRELAEEIVAAADEAAQFRTDQAMTAMTSAVRFIIEALRAEGSMSATAADCVAGRMKDLASTMPPSQEYMAKHFSDLADAIRSRL